MSASGRRAATPAAQARPGSTNVLDQDDAASGSKDATDLCQRGCKVRDCAQNERAHHRVDYPRLDRQVIRRRIEKQVLAEHKGNISAAARALRMHRRTLQRILAKRAPR